MRTKLFIKLLVFIFCTLIYISCSEIIEPNLSKENLTLVSPVDNFQTTSITNTFYWEELKGASKYQIQIAQPSFASLQQLLVDSNVSGNNFTFTLLPGNYEWRVKAKNESSESGFFKRSLVILSSPDLSSQTVILQSPVHNYITNQTNITLKWDTIYSASDYRVQVINSLSSTVIDVIIQTDSFNCTLLEDEYTWKVRAQNATSNSLYSSRSLIIDLTPPPVSSQLLISGDSIFTPDTLFWSRHSESIADSLFIYPDSLISPITYKGYQANTHYIFSGTFNQDYYWRLKSVDAAGNWSGYSPLRKFWIK